MFKKIYERSVDFLIFLSAIPVAYFLRSGVFYLSHYASAIFFMSVLYAVCMLGAMYAFRMHKRMWLYTSVHDTVFLVYAVASGTCAWVFISFLVVNKDALPKSIPLIAMMVTILLTAGIRIVFRFFNDKKFDQKAGRNSSVSVYLVGSLDGCDKTIVSFKNPLYAHYNPVGIITDNVVHVGKKIRGVDVLGVMENTANILEASPYQNKALAIFVDHSATQNCSEAVFKAFSNSGIHALFLPKLKQASDPAKISKMDYDLLLRRHSFDGSMENISAFVQDKVVLITGAGGSIGSEIVRKVSASSPKQIILLDNCEFLLYLIDMDISQRYPSIRKTSLLKDVRNRKGIHHVMATYKPDLVFHAAAVKHVPLSEDNPTAAFEVNVLGTRNVLEASKKNSVALTTLISTDKAVRPTSIMGATKQIAEMLCLSMNDRNNSDVKFLTVRFGNVVGSNGSVIPLFEDQVDKGGPVTVTHPDITRYFMTITEAVHLVLEASSLRFANVIETNNSICVLNMGKPVKIQDLAEQVIISKGKQPHTDIKIVYTGLRPGEKIYEELFDESEELIQAPHEGFMLSLNQDKRTFQEIHDGIQGITLAAQDNNDALVKSLIQSFAFKFQHTPCN